MDLSPFYDLRARLHAGAVAGAALAAEDFRLSRALEALAPLEGAVPVFAKLGELTRALLAPSCPDRAGALLDALSLADAIACTQGAVAVPGEVEPFRLPRRGSAVTNAPYSVLAPLLEALTTSGSGHFSLVTDTHKYQPELFQDYRVKNAMVDALGAAYNELADQVEQWLSQEDESLLPLLQNGFDPRGKKDMVRRVRVMEAVAGAGANEFYLANIEPAEKEVRAALIYALRHDEGNGPKLVELCKTEKGNCKKLAHRALAKLSDPEGWAYLNQLAEKKPDQVAEYVELSTSPQAGVLVAAALDRCLRPIEADREAELSQTAAAQLQNLLYALPGKSGPEICAVYRRMAALGKALDDKSVQNDGKQAVAVRFQTGRYNRKGWKFSEAVPLMLHQALLFHPAPDLIALAGELERSVEESYIIPLLTASLLSRPAAECYELIKPFLNPPISIFKKLEQKAAKHVLEQVLEYVSWDRGTGRQVLHHPYWNPDLPGVMEYTDHPLYENLDPRMYEELMEAHRKLDLSSIIFSLIPENDPSICAYLGEKFYIYAKLTDDNRGFLEPLVRCGWTKCEGLAVRYFTNKKQLSLWELERYVERMPGSARDRAEEAGRVVALIAEKKIKLAYGDLEAYQQKLSAMRGSDE